MGTAVNCSSPSDISTAGESFSTSSENVHHSHGMKKSTRLTMEQTRALEKSFEFEKILEAGRKEELSGALGLRPRQITIWFQNRRAKWKTAQLEKDFGVLKQNYESLETRYHTVVEENQKLQSEMQRSDSILKNVHNKEVMGDRQIDFNIVQEKKVKSYGVQYNTEDNIPDQASMEEIYSQNFLLALKEEDFLYNIDEISGIMSVRSLDCDFPLE